MRPYLASMLEECTQQPGYLSNGVLASVAYDAKCEILRLEDELEKLLQSTENERKIMNFNEYQKWAKSTGIYPESAKVIYPAMGLAGETGELLNILKKIIRDQVDADRDRLVGEIGDILWYLAVLSQDLGIDFDEVVTYNVDKLNGRKARGTLRGSGEER